MVLFSLEFAYYHLCPDRNGPGGVHPDAKLAFIGTRGQVDVGGPVRWCDGELHGHWWWVGFHANRARPGAAQLHVRFAWNGRVTDQAYLVLERTTQSPAVMYVVNNHPVFLVFTQSITIDNIGAHGLAPASVLQPPPPPPGAPPAAVLQTPPPPPRIPSPAHHRNVTRPPSPSPWEALTVAMASSSSSASSESSSTPPSASTAPSLSMAPSSSTAVWV